MRNVLYILLAYFSYYLDFVLVYEEDAAEDRNEDFERNNRWRQQFMVNLRKAGMEDEEVVII